MKCNCGNKAGPTGLCADCFLEQDSSKGSTQRPSKAIFKVWGHAFVPMKVEIDIEAMSEGEAMKLANEKLKTGIREYLIAGSEDEGAAFGFDACEATPL